VLSLLLLPRQLVLLIGRQEALAVASGSLEASVALD